MTLFEIFIAFVALALVVNVCTLLWRLRRGVTRGTAAFARWAGVLVARLTDPPPGLTLGLVKNKYARWSEEGHWIIVASTGAGKSTGVLMPSIVSWHGSMVVVDIKGELSESTASRLKSLGIQVVCIDPIGVRGGAAGVTYAGINPVLQVLNSPDRTQACHSLADDIVDAPGDKEIFTENVKQLCAALIAAASASQDPSLNWVREQLNKGERGLLALGQRDWPPYVVNLLEPVLSMLQSSSTNRIGNVIPQLQSKLAFLDNPNIAEAMRGDWSPDRLLDPERPTALFLILPPQYLRTQAAFLRVMVGSVTRAMLDAGIDRERRLLFVLDEAAALGDLEIVREGPRVYRGYGATLLLAYQDLPQMNAVYGEVRARSILGNCNQMFWSCRDPETCEHVKITAGVATRLEVRSMDNVKEVARYLRTADEVSRMPKDEMIVFVVGRGPTLLKLILPGFNRRGGQRRGRRPRR